MNLLLFHVFIEMFSCWGFYAHLLLLRSMPARFEDHVLIVLATLVNYALMRSNFLLRFVCNLLHPTKHAGLASPRVTYNSYL